MKLLQTLVSAHAFREPAHNDDRLGVLNRLLEVAARDGTDLVLLPGGFLTVPDEQDVPAAIARIADEADRAGVAVIGGVDLPPRFEKSDPEQDKLVRAGRLPYFGFAVGRVTPQVRGGGWRQLSTRRRHPPLLSEEVIPGESRVVSVAGYRVAVLICGELSNWRIREKFAPLGPKLVVDAGHISMGQGLIPGMRRWAIDVGCPIAHAQHVAHWGASHHFIATDGARDSVPTHEDRWVGDDGCWIAWCARAV